MRFLWTALTLFALAVAAPVRATPAGAQVDLITTMTEQLAVDPSGARTRVARELARLGSNGSARRDGRLAAAHWVSAQAHFRLGDNEAARQSLALAEANLPTGRAGRRIRGYIALLTGLMLRADGEAGAALQKFRNAQTDFIVSDEDRGHALALQSVGILYNDAGDGENAIRYLALAGEAYQGDNVFNLSRNINMGVANLTIDRDTDAIRFFEAAQESARRLGIKAFEHRVILNIVTADLNINDTDAARRVLATIGPLNELGENDRRWALQLQASIALRQGRVGEARQLIDRALVGIDSENSQSDDWKIHIAAYEIFLAQGEITAALDQLEAVRRIELADAADIASTRTALLAAQFQSDAQETRIAQLKAATLEREVEFQRNMTLMLVIAGLIVMGLLIGLLVIAIRARNRARADAIELAQVNRQLERALAAKTEFLASTSHELRTPLNGILGMAQIMLADGALSARHRNQIELVRDAGSTMRALVDDILDVAKIEHGGFVITPRPTDVVALVERVTRLFEEQAAERGLVLACHIDLPTKEILIDGDRLTQIIFNLVGNALKFTQTGRIDLSLVVETVEDDDEAGQRLVLRVADTGIGIAPEWQAAVFDMFRQVDNTRTRNYGGTGLGLAICRQLARAMDGDISLASVDGEGTCFTVSLPWQQVIARVAGEAPVTAPTTEQGADGPPNATVAVMANDPMRGAMLAAIARREGLAVKLVDTDDGLAAALADPCLTLLVDQAAWPRVSASDALSDDAIARTIIVGAAAEAIEMAGPNGSQASTVAFSRNAIAAALGGLCQSIDQKQISRLHPVPVAANGEDEMGPEHKRVAPMSRM